MRISRLVLTGLAIGTIIGTGRADLNRTHVFNPAWPPHARFHGAAGWGTVACSQLLAVWLLWRPSQQAQQFPCIYPAYPGRPRATVGPALGLCEPAFDLVGECQASPRGLGDVLDYQLTKARRRRRPRGWSRRLPSRTSF